MSRPLLLDLFCGQGGSAMGYHRAGYEIVGVDRAAQPRFPFRFIQADALEFLACCRVSAFDLIHASPPCQRYSRAQVLHGREHPDLVPATREALVASGRPWVIENVVGAPLVHPVMLCGLMFGLKVFRHRLFETDGWLLSPPHEPHGMRRIGVDGFFGIFGDLTFHIKGNSDGPTLITGSISGTAYLVGIGFGTP